MAARSFLLIADEISVGSNKIVTTIVQTKLMLLFLLLLLLFLLLLRCHPRAFLVLSGHTLLALILIFQWTLWQTQQLLDPCCCPAYTQHLPEAYWHHRHSLL
jgi:hypothetical protein